MLRELAWRRIDELADDGQIRLVLAAVRAP
jgi:hypothetical protein